MKKSKILFIFLLTFSLLLGITACAKSENKLSLKNAAKMNSVVDEMINSGNYNGTGDGSMYQLN